MSWYSIQKSGLLFIASILFILSLFSFSFGEQIPENTGVVMTDFEGKTYNLDSLLDAGKHIVVQQIFAN